MEMASTAMWTTPLISYPSTIAKFPVVCCEKITVIIDEYYNKREIRKNIKFNMVRQCTYIQRNEELLVLLNRNRVTWYVFIVDLKPSKEP